jgi:predicted transcriptional regulator
MTSMVLFFGYQSRFQAVEQSGQKEKSVIDDIRQGLDAMNEGRTVSHKVVQERLRAKRVSVYL